MLTGMTLTAKQLASFALEAGMRPADIVALLDNVDRWKALGIIQAWREARE